MKIILTDDSWIDGKEYSFGTELEVSEEKGAYLIGIHRAKAVNTQIPVINEENNEVRSGRRSIGGKTTNTPLRQKGKEK